MGIRMMTTIKRNLLLFTIALAIIGGLIFIKQYRERQLYTLISLIRDENALGLRSFLKENAKLLNVRDSGGNTPLDICISGANIRENKVYKILLENGANPNILTQGEVISVSPLYHACIRDNADIILINELIKHGADVNIGCYEKGKISETPLMYVCFMGNIDLINLLLNYHADATIKNRNGFSALDFTILSNKYKSKEEKMHII